MHTHPPRSRLVLCVASLLASLAAPAAAQSGPCFNNLVPNGDFASVIPAWFVVGPPAATYPTLKVNGIDDTRCLQVASSGNQPFTLSQPTPFQLVGGQTYEASIDVLHVGTAGNYMNVDFGIVSGSTRTTLFASPSGPFVRVSSGPTRLAVLFQAPSTGSYTVDVKLVSNRSFAFDNVVIRPNDLLFSIDGPRAAGTNETLRVEGEPNSLFALHVSDKLLPSCIGIPGLNGKFCLDPPAIAILGGSLNGNGVFSVQVPYPSQLAGVALYWQAGALPPPTSGPPRIGCPARIGMP